MKLDIQRMFNGQSLYKNTEKTARKNGAGAIRRSETPREPRARESGGKYHAPTRNQRSSLIVSSVRLPLTLLLSRTHNLTG